MTSGGVATFGTASLISSKGLIVSAISEDLTDDEKVEAADAQLATNRANCEGMDQVASEISTILTSTSITFVCKDQFDDDCDSVSEDSKTLLTKITLLIQTSSQSIEDSSISTLSSQIVTLLKSITILSYEQKTTLESLTATIKFTVFIYVSQISIIESKKLEIAGALKFPGATVSIDEVDVKDIEQQRTVLTTQLTNLFQIADANDAVIECIATIEELPAASDPEPNADLSNDVEDVPGMCGAPEPPVEEVQKTASSITKLCSTLTEQPTAAELNTLIFIKQSLITFKQTFISQISIFSQKLSVITGSVVTAASLKVEVITASGELGVATEVDITGGNEVGSEAFIVYRIEVLMSVLNAVISVLTKISTILSLSSGSVDANTAANFALDVSTFSAALSSGFITIDILDTAKTILQTDISSLPATAIVILLESAQTSLQSLQLSIVSEISLHFQLLVNLQVSVSSITFTIKDFDSDGSIISTDVSGSTIIAGAGNVGTAIKNLEILADVQTLTEAALTLEFSTITTAVTEVSLSVFLNKLTSFFIVFGQNIMDTDIVSLGTELLQLKISVTVSQTIKSVIQYIMFIIDSLLIQISTQIVITQQQVTVDTSSLSLTTLEGIQTLYLEIISVITAASESTSVTATTSALSFYELCEQFFIVICSVTLENFAVKYDLIIQLGTQIIEAGSLGVSISSERYQFIYITIINSLNIFIQLIQTQVTIIIELGVSGGPTAPPGVTETLIPGVTDTADPGTGTIFSTSSDSMMPSTIMTTKMPLLTTVGRPIMTTIRPIPTGFNTMMTTKNRPSLTTPNRHARVFNKIIWKRMRGLNKM